MKEQQLELEVQEHREAQREAIIFKVLRAAVTALAERGLQYLSLAAVIGLFAWAVYDPQSKRIAAASLFAALVYLPTLFKKGAKNAE